MTSLCRSFDKLEDFWNQHQFLDSVLHPGKSLTFHSDDSLRSTTEHHLNTVGTSEPIQIPKRLPRRRLFSGGSISEEEEFLVDSGFDSPAHIKQINNGDIIHEEVEFGSGPYDDYSTVFTFEDDVFPSKYNSCFSAPNVSYLEARSQPVPKTLDIIPHHRVSVIRNQYASSRQVTALCSPATHPPSMMSRPRSHSQQSSTSNVSCPTSMACGYIPYIREQTVSNVSLFSFGSPIGLSSPFKSESISGLYVCQDSRQRSHSDASAPPLAFYYDCIQGYEDTTSVEAVCMGPPPSPFDYYLRFTSEPPPPYEEEDSVVRDEAATCEKHAESFPNGVGVANHMDEYSFVPNDNHAYNPQWLQSMDINSIPENDAFRNFSEDDAIEALSKFVSSNCCYNNGVTKHMRMKEINPSQGHQYILETYYEERSTAWHQEPYAKQPIDGAENGFPPPAWEITVSRPKMFQPHVTYVEIPHTASVKECPGCSGKGAKYCQPCEGKGDIKCVVCDGLGILQQYVQEDLSVLERRVSTGARTCHSCNGGKRLCQHCSGKGEKVCNTCTGSGRVKVYIRLTVRWKTLKAYKIFGKSKLPKRCITEVSGTLVFQEQNDRVYPLLDFPEDEVNIYSRKLISRHEEQLQNTRIIMQRHCVREVPVTEVRSQWKRQEFTYWVYGNENQVYCPDYPSKCMMGCTIL